MILTITAILAIGIIICAFWAIYTREEKIKELKEDVDYWENSSFKKNLTINNLFKETERLISTIKDDTELIGQLNKKLKAKKK